MSFRWSAITIDCDDPIALAGFWAQLLDGEIDEPLPGWRRLVLAGGAFPALTFQPVPEPKRDKARLHLDLVVDDVDGALREAVRLGGSSLDQRHEYPEGVVVVLADPEGNEFCVVAYADEPPATGRYGRPSSAASRTDVRTAE